MKILRKISKWFIAIIIMLLFAAFIFVRFTNGSINTSSKTILGYDEEKKRFQIWENKTYNLNGIDGPYIIGNSLYEVTEANKLQHRQINRKDSIRIRVDNEDNDQFGFQLKDSISSNPDIYTLPEKMIALSDIEGNFNAFAGFLMSNGVIDENFNWIFGNGHLLLNGDFVDRGENVTQVLWLIYKLENQALTQGGRIHYILGNHEIMNFQGRASYSRSKYKRVAQLISKQNPPQMAVQYMYSDKTELGAWLRSKNVIEKIGRYIFVHAGLSPDILKYHLTIPHINQIAKNNWDKDLYDEQENGKAENLIAGKKGIYWYRGLAIDYKYYKRITESELNEILSFYDADKIIFGHTVMEDITTGFNGKTISLDVKHGLGKASEKTKGVLIENGVEYKINGKGTKIKL